MRPPWFCRHFDFEQCIFNAGNWHPDKKTKIALQPFKEIFTDLGDYFNLENDKRNNAWQPLAATVEFWHDEDFAEYRKEKFIELTAKIQDGVLFSLK